MSYGEALRSSAQALRANKFRAFLTALGLVIGNASVILVVTISLTSRDYILRSDPGHRIQHDLTRNYDGGHQSGHGRRDADFIKIADVEAVRQQLGSRIVAATGVMTNFDRMRDRRPRGRRRDHRRRSVLSSQCATWSSLPGGFFDAEDIDAAQQGRAADRADWPSGCSAASRTALGQIVKLHGLQFTVIGTFKEKVPTASANPNSTGENVLIPITVLRYFAPWSASTRCTCRRARRRMWTP